MFQRRAINTLESANARRVIARSPALIPVLVPTLASTVTVKAVILGSSLFSTICGSRSSCTCLDSVTRVALAKRGARGQKTLGWGPMILRIRWTAVLCTRAPLQRIQQHPLAKGALYGRATSRLGNVRHPKPRAHRRLYPTMEAARPLGWASGGKTTITTTSTSTSTEPTYLEAFLLQGRTNNSARVADRERQQVFGSL